MSRIYVCGNCVEDSELQDVVCANAISEGCDYCGRVDNSPIACELCDVVERINFAIYQEYGPPHEETVYDKEEGDYFGNVLEITDVFEDIGFHLANEQLQDDIVGSFWSERFCRKGMLSGSSSERQMDAWNGFKEIVKHRRRYTFWSMPEGDCDHGIIEHPPAEMMKNIALTMSEFDLAKEISVGKKFWRVRIHDKSKSLDLPTELSAPTSEQAKFANRMSPAGVSMFYGSDRKETAILETVDSNAGKDKCITGGAFKNLRSLIILDLHDLPELRSFFMNWRESVRDSLAFLKAFQADISGPIAKDGLHHIAYVPTQVFTEFIRYELKPSIGEAFDGIRFKSSKDGRGCYVLFFDQTDCLPDIEFRRRDQQLEFVEASKFTLPVEEFRENKEGR